MLTVEIHVHIRGHVTVTAGFLMLTQLKCLNADMNVHTFKMSAACVVEAFRGYSWHVRRIPKAIQVKTVSVRKLHMYKQQALWPLIPRI